MVVTVKANPTSRRTGQAYVGWLSKRTLNLVKLTHEGDAAEYVSVDLKNQANAEADVIRGYHGRYLFELLQNANDAITAAREDPAWRKAGQYRVRIQLTESALIVANDGVPFLEKDVDSIYQWGASSKDPNKSIGHKGIGFKSVLDITESPQVLSKVVHFHFDRKTCHLEVRRIVGRDVIIKLPITRFIFPLSFEQLQDDRVLVEQLLGEEKYSTVVRLPFKNKGDIPAVLERIQEDVQAMMLLFLNGIDQIEVITGPSERRTLSRQVKEHGDDDRGRDITLLENGEANSRWLLFDAPKVEIKDRAIINELKDDMWDRVKKTGFALAFPLDENGHLDTKTAKTHPLFVYFPTEQHTNLQFCVQGDFYVDAARKNIPPRKYNTWLAEQIAAFLGDTVMKELVSRFPNDERLVRILVPIGTSADFPHILEKVIHGKLRDCPFVPCAGTPPQTPRRVALAPAGIGQEIDKLHRYFPTNELARRVHGRAFPLSEIERDEASVTFLLELGSKRLSFQDVFRQLDGSDPCSGPEEYPQFYRFLWDWSDHLDLDQRLEFMLALNGTRSIATSSGNWIAPQEQIYHAKLQQETPSMPSALRAKLVHPAVYKDEGIAGGAYKLLSALKPTIRNYDAREIIRSAIMPVFEGERFAKLTLIQRSEIYQYLFTYWRSRKGTADTEVDQVIGKALVPGRSVIDGRGFEWMLASDVYLGEYWTGDKRLERLYSGFEDAYFLKAVPGITVKVEVKDDWAKFWEWLGAARMPRLWNVPFRPGAGWLALRAKHRYVSSELWGSYVDQMRREHGTCPKHGADYLELRRVGILHGFDRLIASGDIDRLSLLGELLAENWEAYKKHPGCRGTVHCTKARCPQWSNSKDVPSFFWQLLTRAAWTPARWVNGRTENVELSSSGRCWLISNSEEPVVRSVLRSPYGNLALSTHRQFCKDIGMRPVDEATLDDLVDMLRQLPLHYPDPNVTIWIGKKPLTDALATFTRALARRISYMLTSYTQKYPPALAGTVPLVANVGSELRYIEPPEPLFFADTPYQASQWRGLVPFAAIDSERQDVAHYLKLPFISKHVKEDCAPGEKVESESRKLEKNFKNARPYMLALVNSQRASQTDIIARYLANFAIVVVDNLTVVRTLTVPPEKTIPDTQGKVFLDETTGDRVGSAGRAPRSAKVYVRQDKAANDYVARALAEFIGIPGMADAFVILLERNTKEEKLQYLETRGIYNADVEDMRKKLEGLGATSIDETSVEIGQLKLHLVEQIEQLGHKSEGGSQPASTTLLDGAAARNGNSTDKNSKEAEPGDSGLDLPPIDTTQVTTIKVDASAAAVIDKQQSSKSGRGHVKVRRNWERDQKLKELYGKRGEQLVMDLELARLRSEGHPAPDTVLHWLREQGDETADHDISSKELVGGEWEDLIIEVKATPGTDFRVTMSLPEIECAQRWGERYRLYRVIEVATEVPSVYVFENPFTLWQERKARIEAHDFIVVLPNPSTQPGVYSDVQNDLETSEVLETV